MGPGVVLALLGHICVCESGRKVTKTMDLSPRASYLYTETALR